MIGFVGSPLDRDDALRNDPAALLAAARDPSARLLRLDGFTPEVDDDGQLVWDDMGEAADDLPLLFLGKIDGKPRFAAITLLDKATLTAPANWQLMAALSPQDLAIWGAMKSVVDWHCRHQFCAVCGASTTIFRGGWGRQCPSCNAEHFPRVDPVVIMLAVKDNRALVGRQYRFPPNRYSALAGFVEPGESLEEAVRREVFEEAGIRCGHVDYVASQPWPFPSSLMVACLAQAENDDITIDTNELEDAKWVDRAVMRRAFENPDANPDFLLPPPHAIAHQLLRHWAMMD